MDTRKLKRWEQRSEKGRKARPAGSDFEGCRAVFVSWDPLATVAAAVIAAITAFFAYQLRHLEVYSEFDDLVSFIPRMKSPSVSSVTKILTFS